MFTARYVTVGFGKKANVGNWLLLIFK